MNYYLIMEGFNWADEMDLQGFVIANEEQLKNLKEVAEKLSETDEGDELELSLGTNEYQYVSADDMLDTFNSAKPLTEAEVKTLCSILGFEMPKGRDKKHWSYRYFTITYGTTLTEIFANAVASGYFEDDEDEDEDW